MKLFVTLFLSFLILLFGAALIGPNFVDWNKYKAQGQALIKEHAGYDLQIDGDLSVSVFPSPHLIVREAKLKAPVASRKEHLVQIKSLEVYVALSPLLNGDVEFSAVNLIEPSIALEVGKDGAPNWLSTKLKALSDADKVVSKDAEARSSASSTASDAPARQVSFDRVRIKDGRFQYYDARSKSLQVVEDMNLDLSAESLSGPFKLDGDLSYNGMSVSFKASVPSLDMEAKTASLSMTAQLDDKADVRFAGAVDFGDKPGVQGESELIASSLKSLSGGAVGADELALKGFVSADASGLSYKDLNIVLGKDRLSGTVSAKFSPLVLMAEIEAPDGISSVPALAQYRDLGLSTNVGMNDGTIAFRNTKLRLEGQSVLLSGSFTPAKGEKRAALDMDVGAQALDLDKILKTPPKVSNAKQGDDVDTQGTDSNAERGNAGAALEKSLRSIALPIDVAVNADLKSLTYQGKTAKGVKLRGGFAGTGVDVKNLSVRDYEGASIDLRGGVGNLSALSGVSLNADIKAQNVRRVAGAFGVDTETLPKGLKALDLQLQAKGAMDKLDTTANAKFFGASVITKGMVLDALGTPAVSDLVVQIKHPNMSKALQDITGGKAYPTLSKPLDFYAKVDHKDKIYTLNDLRADLAGTAMQGGLQLDMSGKKPALSGDVRLGDFVMMSAAGVKAEKEEASSGGGSSAPAKVRSAQERWSSDPLNAAFLHAMNLDLSLAAKSLRFDHWALSKPSLGIKMRDGVLNIENMSAALYGGTMNVDIALKADDRKDAPVSFATSAKFRDVDIEALTTSLAAGSKLVKGAGKVSLDADIESVGVSQRDLVTALSGKGLVSGQDITLDGVDVSRFIRAMDVDSKPGDSLLSLWKGSTQGRSTVFQTLNGDYVIEKGIVNITNLDLDGEAAAIATSGTVDLPKWYVKLNSKMSAKNREDVPDFDMEIAGSLDNPQQTFAQGPLENYLSRKINRKLEKLLNDKLGQKLDDKLGNEIGGALGGVLGGVLGGGAASAPQQPANDNQPEQAQPQQVQPQPVTQEQQVEEALEGLLRGILQ